MQTPSKQAIDLAAQILWEMRVPGGTFVDGTSKTRVEFLAEYLDHLSKRALGLLEVD